MSQAPRHLVAIDWGTSNFRAFLVDADSGECLDSRRSDAGLRALRGDEFPHYCAAQVNEWRDGGRVPVYLAGMVGSARGWSEAPQLDLPVAASDLARHVVAAPGLDNAWLVPGVKVVEPARVDVMRGEEIQAFGALAAAESDTALCCLPGTHSKWASLEAGYLVDFTTMMTGELYHAVRFHTLPGEPARASDAFDAEGFEQGLRAARHPAGLLHALFEARSRNLYAGLADEQVGSFLSGVMIGSEVDRQRALFPRTAEVLLIGSSALNALYRRAMEAAGFGVREIDSDHATLMGLCALARQHRDE
ncbi:2-keto-3-deoxygalactonate kinase [Modicisalibacter ilicicola DSM 19980]|uniref:2-keto-3-deoxygalactonate kinase n=1 Tax=Modicisalibacter ilicicola DSM 19980 TaxID=1121942 RepID=A0A1M4SWK2_9GAMM|nr:2-dehydro-3-deoxygalactonokinase [Halomonas ilicicola]SHE36571.1 2-keto-3-deoxygalactonate kinase [Halomonas ilicicola DSM 19980]